MANMDTDMADADYDIQIDTEPIEPFHAQESTLTVEQSQPNGEANNDVEMPAAYFESLETVAQFPRALNIQGVNNFGPDEPLDYVREHCPQQPPRARRWINDSSVNIEFETAQDAADALVILTHPDAGDGALIDAPTSRKARPYSAKPDAELLIRQANTGDQKERNASKQSQYYKQNPRDRERPRRRQEPEPEVVLDYDGDGGDQGRIRYDDLGFVPQRRSDAPSSGFKESRYDDAPASRGRRGNDQGRGRQNRDVDSYRPGSHSPRESRFGRLRGRSASPMEGEDGRYGFSEEPYNGRRYRSRDRETRRRRSRSRSHDRSFRQRESYTDHSRRDRDQNITLDGSGRWAKNSSFPKADMGNHRRSDAMDETNVRNSLLSRMTKDGKPVAQASGSRSLESRITRDEPESNYGRLSDRITRDDPDSNYGRLSNRMSRDDREHDYGRRSNRAPRNEPESNYGRLKDDDSAPREDSFQEPVASRGDLASRITWTRDRNDEEEVGFNIRGAAPASGGFSIRGAAGGN